MRSRFETNNFSRRENDPKNYKWGLFYFNPNDSRIIVPKRAKWMGWTLNFANPWTYVILATFICLAVLVGTL